MARIRLAIPLALLLGAIGAEVLCAQSSCPGAIGSDVDRDGIDDFCDDTYRSPFVAPVPAVGYGARRILVAHFKFPEVSTPPFDIAATRQRFTGKQPFSVSQFFSEISFGATEPTFDIREWADLPHERAFYQASDPHGNSLVHDALAYVGSHYDLNGVDIVVMMVMPLDIDYPGVYAYLPPGLSIGNSGFQLPVAVLTLGVPFNGSASAAHELGHTYGFLHSSLIVCRTWPYAIPPTLTDPYYSDTPCAIFPNQSNAVLAAAGYDFMGASCGHPNAFLKWQAGWLKPQQIIEAPTSGAFVLDSYETASDGAKAIRIPYGIDAEGKPVWFWIEYRTKSAIDLENREVKPYPTDRVLIWVNLPSLYPTSTSFTFSTTDTPTPLQPDGMTLPAGGTFTDPYRGFRIVRGANSDASGIKRSPVTIERSGLRFDPSLAVKLGPGEVRDVRVTNTGELPVVLRSVQLTGRTPSAFMLSSNSCSSATLQKGGECRVSIRRAASLSGFTYAQLQFATDDPLWPLPAIGLIGQAGDVLSFPPAAPVIGTPVAADAAVQVFFTAGALGSGSLVHYTASCTGGLASTGASSPILVRGLTNGVATRCVVKTTSTAGDSEWSAPSVPVKPTQGPRRRATRS